MMSLIWGKQTSCMSNNFKIIQQHFNREYSILLSAVDETAGGNKGGRTLCIRNGSQRYINHPIPPMDGSMMQGVLGELKNAKRIGFPKYLDPKTASFIDVAIHAKIRQFLSDSTIIKNLRYARFMETHPVPIDFRNLNPEQFIDHMDYRIEIEGASPYALAHEKKAILMFLRAYGIVRDEKEMKLWSQMLKTPPITVNDEPEIVFPEIVHRFFIYEGYSNKRNYEKRVYENRLFQTIAFTGFMFGMRCPSEVINLNVDDLVINKNGTGFLRVHEQKKHGRVRKIIPFNKSILSSYAFKTPGNYIAHWRPKVENEESGDALFLQPSGKRITGGYLQRLSRIGKQIAGKDFHLYLMRHTFATFLYAETHDITFVSRMLGHTKLSNTGKYVHLAECLEQQYDNRSLFNIALRPRNVGGKDCKQTTLGRGQKKARPKVISFCYKNMGLAGFLTDFIGRNTLGHSGFFPRPTRIRFEILFLTLFFYFFLHVYVKK